MALINTTTTGVLGSTFFGDGTGPLTIQQNGVTLGVYGNIPTFAATMSANQTVANATSVKLAFDTKIFDTANCYDSTTNYRYTPNVAGYYFIHILCAFAGAGGTKTGIIMPQLYVNGSTVYQLNRSYCASDYPSSTGSLVLYLNGSTDYIEAYVNQSTGGSGIIQGLSQFARFGATLVKAA
jgi:hypothetical protein